MSWFLLFLVGFAAARPQGDDYSSDQVDVPTSGDDLYASSFYNKENYNPTSSDDEHASSFYNNDNQNDPQYDEYYISTENPTTSESNDTDPVYEYQFKREAADNDTSQIPDANVTQSDSSDGFYSHDFSKPMIEEPPRYSIYTKDFVRETRNAGDPQTDSDQQVEGEDAEHAIAEATDDDTSLIQPLPAIEEKPHYTRDFIRENRNTQEYHDENDEHSEGMAEASIEGASADHTSLIQPIPAIAEEEPHYTKDFIKDNHDDESQQSDFMKPETLPFFYGDDNTENNTSPADQSDMPEPAVSDLFAEDN